MDKPRDIPKPVKPTPEQMGRQLETKVSQQRPNKILLGMLLVLLALLPVGFLLWFFWPGPEPPKIIAVGFDELAFPGKPVELTGLLIKADPSEEGIVGGWPVNFEFFKPEMLKNPEAKLQKTTSAPDGSAQAKFHLSGKIKLAEFAFRFTPENAEKFAEDRASVFLVNPKQLILVDVESALAKAAIREWESKSLNDIPRNISAAKFLGTKAKAGFSIVYFACTVPSPITYRRVRFWVQSNPPKDVPPFPRGPLLGKP